MGFIYNFKIYLNNLIMPNSYDYYPAEEILRHELSKEPYGDLLQNYVEGNFRYAVDWLESQQLLR